MPYSVGCAGVAVNHSRGGSNPSCGTTTGVKQGAPGGCDDK